MGSCTESFSHRHGHQGLISVEGNAVTTVVGNQGNHTLVAKLHGHTHGL